MIEPTEISTFFPLYDDTPEILPSLCLRKRHKDVKCTRCIRNCPLRALHWNGSLQINPERCNNCGICIAVCPTGAFESQKDRTSLLLKEIEEALSLSDEVGWACSSCLREEGHSFPLVIEVSCLGRVDESLLVAAVARGAQRVWINQKTCADCRFSLGEKISSRSAKRANRLLGFFGEESPIRLGTEFPSALKKRSLKYGKKPRGEALSRREFFRGLRGVNGQNIRKSNQREEERLLLKELIGMSRVPPKRRLLLDSLKELGEPPSVPVNSPDLPFGVIEITEECDHCDLCVLLCPTTALIKEETEETRIYLRSAYCTKCRLCQKVCLKKAIHFRSQVNLGEVLAEEKVKLRGAPLGTCLQCGEIFPDGEGNDFCPWCERNKKEDELYLELGPPHLGSS